MQALHCPGIPLPPRCRWSSVQHRRESLEGRTLRLKVGGRELRMSPSSRGWGVRVPGKCRCITTSNKSLLP